MATKIGNLSQRQYNILQRTCRWITENPAQWIWGAFAKVDEYLPPKKGEVFGRVVPLEMPKFCALGVAHYITEAESAAETREKADMWSVRMFGTRKSDRIIELNDMSRTPDEAVRRLRAFMGNHRPGAR